MVVVFCDRLAVVLAHRHRGRHLAFDQDVTRAQTKERDEGKVRLREERIARCAGDVDLFIQALLEELEAHPGSNREPAKMEPVFGKDREVGRLAGVEAAEQTGLRVRRRAAFVVAILQARDRNKVRR